MISVPTTRTYINELIFYPYLRCFLDSECTKERIDFIEGFLFFREFELTEEAFIFLPEAQNI